MTSRLLCQAVCEFISFVKQTVVSRSPDPHRFAMPPFAYIYIYIHTCINLHYIICIISLYIYIYIYPYTSISISIPLCLLRRSRPCCRRSRGGRCDGRASARLLYLSCYCYMSVMIVSLLVFDLFVVNLRLFYVFVYCY